MTIGFSRWLRAFACAMRQPLARPRAARAAALDVHRLGTRDLADLNLPEDVAQRLYRQAAEEARRVWPR